MFPVIISRQVCKRKSTLQTRWIQGRPKIGFMNTHLPIARRSNGDTKQAVLLTLLPRYPSSRFLSDIIGFAPHYSGGTVPAFHRSSLLSPQGTFLFIFGCHYSITLDSCCQIDFATWYETGRFRNRQGHSGLSLHQKASFCQKGCPGRTDSCASLISIKNPLYVPEVPCL